MEQRSPQTPKPLVLRPVTGITLFVFDIPDLLKSLCKPTLPVDYRTKPARKFDHRDFNLEFLSSDERSFLNQFKVLKKQAEWLCGRFSLKHLAKTRLLLKTPLDRIAILTREEGAPFLEQKPDIPVSLSHSGRYTAAAIGQQGSALGIDIEKIDTMPSKAFLKTAFTRREIDHMPMEAFDAFRHWTLKEAYLKYIGKGFHESLHKVEVVDDTIFHNGAKTETQLWSKALGDDYVISLVAGPDQAS